MTDGGFVQTLLYTPRNMYINVKNQTKKRQIYFFSKAFLNTQPPQK
jgi:hypothetical protein